MIIENPDSLHQEKLDQVFIEVCEPGSIEIVSVFAEWAEAPIAALKDNVVHLSLKETTKKVVVRLSGVRRGRTGRRFPEFTVEQAYQNSQFWSQAYEVR